MSGGFLNTEQRRNGGTEENGFCQNQIGYSVAPCSRRSSRRPPLPPSPPLTARLLSDHADRVLVQLHQPGRGRARVGRGGVEHRCRRATRQSPYAAGNLVTRRFLRSRGVPQVIYSTCRFIQLSAVVPNARDKRTAISGLIRRGRSGCWKTLAAYAERAGSFRNREAQRLQAELPKPSPGAVDCASSWTEPQWYRLRRCVPHAGWQSA